MIKQEELIPHLFRTEYSKITAVLCKLFGIEHIQVAEDIASDTFLSAMETWPYKGLPQNPVAWLYSVAKNKARNHLKRSQVFDGKIAGHLQQSSIGTKELDIDLSEQNISDSQLQMLFALCHPSIPPEAQVGLSLRILCGFGVHEIASAFLTNKETINKRLFRARKKLRKDKVRIELPPGVEIEKRLDTVLTTLYLLFNEGYYSESQDSVLREDLCLEAIRLTELLTRNDTTNLPKVHALLALMYFHSSRFRARKGSSGESILYDDQDESLWDQALIAKGVYHFRQASQGNQLSTYHLEGGIAYWHTQKTDSTDKWENILQLYNLLLQVQYSPVAALNRTFALSKANGKEEAIIEAEKLNLQNNHYYFTLLGELYKDINKDKAVANLQKALGLAKTKTDRRTIQARLQNLTTSLPT
jgi:RNA polymerase sigma factor (sigma-70 family)